MRILVLGATGMIGHRMWASLSKFHDVHATIRKSELGALEQLEGIDKDCVFYNVDVLDDAALLDVFQKVKPEMVLNCVGVVKQLAASKNHIVSIELNALFPHKLAKLCTEFGSRMIQFSTDCVFSGKKGMYTEQDEPDATDLYGRSKILGEVDYLDNVLTIRTSSIGREVFPHGGLVEWFLSQEGKEIKGFSKAIYSGFPTHALAMVINDFILPNPELKGIMHVSAEAINKFELLQLVNEELGRDITINEDSNFEMERSLDSSLFQEKVGFKPAPWKELVKDLNVDNEFYNNLKR